jgi:hypothetical protein
MKQPAWESMPVLDVRALSSKQLVKLEKFYDSLSIQNLEPLAKLNSDPVRCQIDRAISKTLGIPDPSFIRELLDREPGLSARDIMPREVQGNPALADLDDDEEEAPLLSQLQPI